MNAEKNGYNLTKQWFDFVAENDEVKAMHSALMTWLIEQCNRLQWPETFGIPTDYTMRMSRIKSYKYYKKTLSDLEKWNFIELRTKSRNQYTCNEIALKLFTKAVAKQVPKQFHHNKTNKTLTNDLRDESLR